jgi:hypothetical protein
VPTKIQVANAALLDFMESHDSWMGIINLLSDRDVFVRYFASNMLLTKVYSELMTVGIFVTRD